MRTPARADFKSWRAARRLIPLCFIPLFGCDPCWGVQSCGAAQLRYSGHLLDSYLQAPVANARVEFVPAPGSRQSDPISARTDSLGFFTLDSPADAAGEVRGELRVFFEDTAQVDLIPSLQISTSPTEADVRTLGTFVVDWPHFEAAGQLYYRSTGEVASNIEVEFRRVDGIQIAPATYVTRTDSEGFFPLRPEPLAVSGAVIGDLIIRPPSPMRWDTIHGIRLEANLKHDPSPLVGRWGIGPHLPYVGQVLWGDTGEPASGITVGVRRVGGILIEPSSYEATTNEWGGFHLGPIPESVGAVDLELTFHRPAPEAPIVYPYTLNTMEKDSGVVLIETWVIPR
jgi:hypothetical protein